MGDAGLLVPGDGDIGARADGGFDLRGRDAEGGVVEEVVDLGVGEALVPARQRGVARQLVGGVGGQGAEGLVEQDLGQGGIAALAGREDVGALAAAVVRDGERGGVGGRCRRGGREGGEQGGAESDESGGDRGAQPCGGVSHTCSSGKGGERFPEGTGGDYRSVR